MKKVTKNTRAGREGKQIQCPHCGDIHTVYHFSWSSLRCDNCGDMVKKYDWLIPEKAA